MGESVFGGGVVETVLRCREARVQTTVECPSFASGHKKTGSVTLDNMCLTVNRDATRQLTPLPPKDSAERDTHTENTEQTTLSKEPEQPYCGICQAYVEKCVCKEPRPL